MAHVWGLSGWFLGLLQCPRKSEHPLPEKRATPLTTWGSCRKCRFCGHVSSAGRLGAGNVSHSRGPGLPQNHVKKCQVLGPFPHRTPRFLGDRVYTSTFSRSFQIILGRFLWSVLPRIKEPSSTAAFVTVRP